MAARVTGSEADALDILQDAMVSFVRHARKRPRDQWRLFFYRCLWSRIRDRERRQRLRLRFFRPFFTGRDGGRENELENVAAPQVMEPQHALERKSEREMILAALGLLPLRQQQTLMLREWQGFSVAETAEIMGCSSSSVKTHYARGLKSLREILEREGVVHEG